MDPLPLEACLAVEGKTLLLQRKLDDFSDGSDLTTVAHVGRLFLQHRGGDLVGGHTVPNFQVGFRGYNIEQSKKCGSEYDIESVEIDDSY